MPAGSRPHDRPHLTRGPVRVANLYGVIVGRRGRAIVVGRGVMLRQIAPQLALGLPLLARLLTCLYVSRVSFLPFEQRAYGRFRPAAA